MLINAIWGGIGCGLQQFLVYLLLSVFLAGLMTGRTPELFGRKIEAPEVRLLALLILLQPLVVLGFTARHAGDPVDHRQLQPRLPRHQPGVLRVHLGLRQQRLRFRGPGRCDLVVEPELLAGAGAGTLSRR